MKRFLVLLMAVSLVGAAPLWGKDKKDSEKDIAQAMARVTEKLADRDIMLYAEQVSTVSGYFAPLMEAYYIRIKGNRIDSHLPYVGRADDPFAASEGLKFRGRLQNFKVVDLPKGGKKVTFEVKTLDDFYKFTIDLTAEGDAEIMVAPTGKQKVFFDGYLAPDAEDYRGKI